MTTAHDARLLPVLGVLRRTLAAVTPLRRTPTRADLPSTQTGGARPPAVVREVPSPALVKGSLVAAPESSHTPESVCAAAAVRAPHDE